MTVTLRGPATGSTLSDHDALYAYPKNWELSAGATVVDVTATDTGLPRVTLPDAATNRVKWVWAIPVRWDAVRINAAVINENVGTGNVRWQFTYKLIALGEGNVDGAVTGTVLVTLSSGGQFDWTYHQIAASILTPVGVLGDAQFMMCSLSRLGADGADTLAGGISLGVTTATRVDI